MAERSSDKRDRQKFRLRLAEVLIDMDRLGQWDDRNRIAIDRARDQLLADYIDAAADAATSGAPDPVPRRTSSKSTSNHED